MFCHPGLLVSFSSRLASCARKALSQARGDSGLSGDCWRRTCCRSLIGCWAGGLAWVIWSVPRFATASLWVVSARTAVSARCCSERPARALSVRARQFSLGRPRRERSAYHGPSWPPSGVCVRPANPSRHVRQSADRCGSHPVLEGSQGCVGLVAEVILWRACIATGASWTGRLIWRISSSARCARGELGGCAPERR